MSTEKPAQEAAKAADQTRPNRPKPKRVSNDHGVWVYGTSARRTVLLLHQRHFKELADSGNMFEDAVQRAMSLVLGVADLAKSADDEGVYDLVLLSSPADNGR